MSATTFKRGQKVLYRRSVLCGRDPEYGIIVRKATDVAVAGDWYVVRDAEPNPWNGNRHGRFCEHAEMLEAA